MPAGRSESPVPARHPVLRHHSPASTAGHRPFAPHRGSTLSSTPVRMSPTAAGALGTAWERRR